MAKRATALICGAIVALAVIGCIQEDDDYFYNDHGSDLISSYSVFLRDATSSEAKATSIVLEIGSSQLSSSNSAASTRLEWNENICHAKLSDLARTWTISFIRDGEREDGCRVNLSEEMITRWGGMTIRSCGPVDDLEVGFVPTK